MNVFIGFKLIQMFSSRDSSAKNDIGQSVVSCMCPESYMASYANEWKRGKKRGGRTHPAGRTCQMFCDGRLINSIIHSDHCSIKSITFSSQNETWPNQNSKQISSINV